MSAFPRVIVLTVPRHLNGATIERTVCVTLSIELDGDAENGLLLHFRLQQVRPAPKGWRELSSVSEERRISTTFVGCCSATSIAARKLQIFVEKIQWWMNDPSMCQRSASGEKQKISTHLLQGETFRGCLVIPQKPLNAFKNA